MVFQWVPLELNWLAKDGEEVSEHTATVQVSASGAIVLLSKVPPLGAKVRLRNCHNNRTAIVRTAGMRPSLELHIVEVALEFQSEDETFWSPTSP
jgi:hypothetical protein